MSSHHSFVPALPIISLALVACGGGGSTDIEGTLVFADRTDAELVRLINAAGGTDMFGAQSAMEQFGDAFDPDPCPVIAIAGDTATITGGCTTADGVQIDGTGSVTNPSGWDTIEYDYTSDTTYQMNALTITQSGFTQTFDGLVVISDNHTTYDADVTVGQLDVTVRSDLYYHCSNPSDPSCSVSGSGLELVGVGGATLSGGIEYDLGAGSQEADFTLKGVDTLTIRIANNCVEWSIEGTDRGMDCTD
jgi:hypothetical protein